VTDPLHLHHETEKVLSLVAQEANRYLMQLDHAPVRTHDSDAVAMSFSEGSLPEEGEGAFEALQELIHDGIDAAHNSAGPRFFHFVTGGATPAALGADWLTSVLDQNAALWISSPLAARLEAVSIAWLQDLFGLPEDWGGVLTDGATSANFTGLGAARRWWGLEHGVDVDEHGLGSLPEIPVLSSGYIHVSARKALAMLGIGRSTVRTFARDAVGRIDLEAMESALKDLKGAPAIVVANASEVNAGDFDPISTMADLAEKYNAWLHVDGAFGLFAAVSPRTSHLLQGLERADSVIADAHKWLNVPYDSGFAFVKRPELLPGAFGVDAAYLVSPDDPKPNFNFLGPQASRRARSLAVWATLRAYGRSGYRAMIERHLDLAQRVAQRVRDADDLELLADVVLNIVCFRFRPPGASETVLNDLNARLGAAVLEDGRVFVGTTDYGGRIAFRPAIVNWRSTEDDVDLMTDVIRELGAQLARGSG
jgi:glutamate/tyrosine decarboxylase-like PLP-dependent enzyme